MSRYYTREHEWIELAGETATVGITDYAQGQLGDITFVELPEVGAGVAQGEGVSVVDSVKAASDVYCPVAGEVVAINPALADRPELVNEAAEAAGEGGGWLWQMRLSDPAQLDGLMDQAAYQDFVASL